MMQKWLYLMFKTEDSLEDTIIYLFIMLISGFIALFVLSYIVSITDFLGEPLSVVLGKDLNPFLRNPDILFFFYLIFVFTIFLSFYFFYNIRRFVPDYKKYIHDLIRNSIIFLIFTLISIWIRQHPYNLDNHIINYILICIISFFGLLSSMLFFMFFIPLLYNLIPYNNKIKNNIKNTQLELKELIKESYENKNSNKEEIEVKKRLLRIQSIASCYTDSLKGLKNSFGYATNFNKINYIGLNNKESLNQTLDHLTISIPFYIFHGKIEQINEMNTHLNNLQKHIGDGYSIAGKQALTEILNMNDTVKKYFRENSFKLSNNNKFIHKQDNFFLTKIFTIIIFPIVYSLILSKINLNP